MQKHEGLSLTGFPLSAIGFVNAILSQAVGVNASDVHIERCRTFARLRYRLDGVLISVKSGSFLFEEYSAVVARIRILASLDIAERRSPQDGRFSHVCEHGTVDVRVSILQTVSGERIVLRLLNVGSDKKDFDALGMIPRQVAVVERAVREHQGMILVTGSTGSGKTTTLYTALNYINTEGINILTVEDPVERRFDGVGQVQINEQSGLGFATVLRAFLRQDPEVILVGEIRDLETADIAFKAALTGHLVLSTLHTKDSVATIVRLANIGLDHHLIGGALNLILAQRLVRVICEQCKIKDDMPVDLLKAMGFENDELIGAQLFRGKGCAHCAWTGYRGRYGIFEMLKIDEKMRDVIQHESPASEIRHLLAKQGGLTLEQSRRRLLLTSVIDLAEYQRHL